MRAPAISTAVEFLHGEGVEARGENFWNVAFLGEVDGFYKQTKNVMTVPSTNDKKKQAHQQRGATSSDACSQRQQAIEKVAL